MAAVPGTDAAPESPFPAMALAYGVFSPLGGVPRVGVALGSRVLDLAVLEARGLLGGLDRAFARSSLNAFMSTGRRSWIDVRNRLIELLTGAEHRREVETALHRLDSVRLHLPFEVGDYVDFYSSLDHAANLGRILRPGAEPLAPNWRHLPVGYHGRAGSIVVSGTPVVRPCGQRKETTDPAPTFGPTSRLDMEAEVGFVIGVGSQAGERVKASSFADRVFGVILVNDWSARDIQAWEYLPLGPFLAKSFATSVSPWIVPLDALAEARVTPLDQRPSPLAYLHDDDPWALDLSLEVRLNGQVVSHPPFAQMYWTPGQQLAHMTASGASVRTGDLYASGTVSGPEPDQRGSLIELAWNGTAPLQLADGTTRTWLEDGDTVSISGWAPGPGGTRIGLGEVSGTILPAVAP